MRGCTCMYVYLYVCVFVCVYMHAHRVVKNAWLSPIVPVPRWHLFSSHLPGRDSNCTKFCVVIIFVCDTNYFMFECILATPTCSGTTTIVKIPSYEMHRICVW